MRGGRPCHYAPPLSPALLLASSCDCGAKDRHFEQPAAAKLGSARSTDSALTSIRRCCFASLPSSKAPFRRFCVRDDGMSSSTFASPLSICRAGSTMRRTTRSVAEGYAWSSVILNVSARVKSSEREFFFFSGGFFWPTVVECSSDNTCLHNKCSQRG